MQPEAFSEEEILARLRQVENDSTHAIPLRFDDAQEENLYRLLAQRGLIRWCPYPEEFYVVTPEGRSNLAGGADR